MSQNPNTPSSWGIQLSQLWTLAGQGFPVDPKEIALEVSKTKFEDKIAVVHGHNISGVEGMLVKSTSKNEWYVLYDETIATPGRINFTVAHELGHYLLHRQQQSSFKCSQDKMLQYDSPQSIIQEKQANEFSSYLLMPIPDYRSQIDGHRVTLDLIGHCADRYRVSITAGMLKWIEFTDETAIVVVARDDFILWSYPSKSAKRMKIFYPKGTPVPEISLNNLVSENSRNSTQRIKPGVWHPQFEAEESVINSDRFDLQIFLIKFPFATLQEFEEEREMDTLDYMKYRGK